LIQVGWLVLALLAGSAGVRDGPVEQGPALSVRADTASGGRALLRIGSVLGDQQLGDALRSGLPLRVKVRVELWRDGIFDHLESSETWTTVVLFEPLDEQYIVRPPGGQVRRFADYADARAAIESQYPLAIAPRRGGSYYYTATLEIETLSLSDLDELQRWLRGELGPAVSGERSIGSAMGEGAKRLLIRILGLPSRRIEARSQQFRIN
jgi:Domain of unknown function (DUF4390)